MPYFRSNKSFFFKYYVFRRNVHEMHFIAVYIKHELEVIWLLMTMFCCLFKNNVHTKKRHSIRCCHRQILWLCITLIHSGDYRYRIYLSDSSNNECQWNIAMIDTATLQWTSLINFWKKYRLQNIEQFFANCLLKKIIRGFTLCNKALLSANVRNTPEWPTC